MFNPPSSVSQAAGFIENLVAAPTCELVRPGAEFLDLLMETARQSDARGNLMFDAQIAALCQEHGIDTVLTNDRDFGRFDSLAGGNAELAVALTSGRDRVSRLVREVPGCAQHGPQGKPGPRGSA